MSYLRPRPSKVRWYSEHEHPFGPPPDPGYMIGLDGEPILLPRDTRTWISVEWAERHRIPVPENWRELH